MSKNYIIIIRISFIIVLNKYFVCVIGIKQFINSVAKINRVISYDNMLLVNSYEAFIIMFLCLIYHTFI